MKEPSSVQAPLGTVSDSGALVFRAVGGFFRVNATKSDGVDPLKSSTAPRAKARHLHKERDRECLRQDDCGTGWGVASVISMTELKPSPLRLAHVDLLKAIFNEIENITAENEKEMPTTSSMHWSRKGWGVKATNRKKTFFFTTDPSLFKPLSFEDWKGFKYPNTHTSYCFPPREMISIFDYFPREEILLLDSNNELLAHSSNEYKHLTSSRMRPKNIEDLLTSSQREFTRYDFLEGREIPFRHIQFDESHPIVETAKKIGLKSYNTGVLIDDRI